tara:strand:+ start:102 stop:809 length:708 start_codon:yes stop_codon:yes gene_type:complete
MSFVAAGIALVGGVYSAVSAGKARKEARDQRRQAEARLQVLEANREDPINPYRDLTNPFANLQIATRAAEMQAEQADISLASSLDTLRATGASAGGATALARAAAQSKRGVSASIEQQEAKNAQLRAQGEIQTTQLRGQGEMWQFEKEDAQTFQQMERQAGLADVASQQEAAYKGQETAGIATAVGAVGSTFVDTSGNRAKFKMWKEMPGNKDETWASFKESEFFTKPWYLKGSN